MEIKNEPIVCVPGNKSATTVYPVFKLLRNSFKTYHPTRVLLKNVFTKDQSYL